MNEKIIVDLETQVKVLQRKLANSKMLNASTEQIAREARQREVNTASACQTLKSDLSKTLERLDILEGQLQITRLQKSCALLEREIECKEKRVMEIKFDQDLHLPVKIDKRRELKRLDKELHDSNRLHEGQQRLLSSLVGRQNRLEEMRTAAANGDLDAVKSLMRQDVSVNTADSAGICAFKYACGQGHVAVVEEMIPVADVNNIDGRCSPLHIAVGYNRISVVEILVRHNARVNEPNESGESSMHIACQHGFLDVLKLLIDGGANVNQLNSRGDTSLHYCVQANRNIANLAEMASLLLESGADDEVKNLDGLTPITIATTKRMHELVLVLKDARTIIKE